MATKSTKKKAAPKKAAKRAPKQKASPKAKAPGKPKAATADAPGKAPAKVATPRPRDPRLPRPGAVLTKTFQGKEIKIEVLDAGFRYDGKVWRSLSAIAKAVTGTGWNGYLWLGLQTRAKAPADQNGGAQ